MIEYRNGRRRVLRAGARESARIKLILAALIALSACGMLALILLNGFQESILSFSLPPYRLYGNASAPVMNTLPALAVKAPLSLSEVETVHSGREAAVSMEQRGPQILIYHTHATEAYLKTPEAPYAESGKWRCEDPASSVVAVGALLAQTLRDVYGLEVLHDTANHEPPKLSTAYSRSLSAIQAYRSRYPSLHVFIDVHRDAYGTADPDGMTPKDYLVIDGRETARIMFVVGTGKGATGAGFDESPDFDANYAFAEAVTEALKETDAGLARDIRVKTGRYNQHVSPRCLLVEAGHNANTLEQAKNAVPYLAAAISQVLNEGTIETASAPARDVWTPIVSETGE